MFIDLPGHWPEWALFSGESELGDVITMWGVGLYRLGSCVAHWLKGFGAVLRLVAFLSYDFPKPGIIWHPVRDSFYLAARKGKRPTLLPTSEGSALPTRAGTGGRAGIFRYDFYEQVVSHCSMNLITRAIALVISVACVSQLYMGDTLLSRPFWILEHVPPLKNTPLNVLCETCSNPIPNDIVHFL